MFYHKRSETAPLSDGVRRLAGLQYSFLYKLRTVALYARAGNQIL